MLPTPQGRQSDVVYMSAEGHQVVLGTAGTGKTVMAMLRAMHLAKPATRGSGPVLLVTYNNALVAYLKHLKDASATAVTVETYGKFARGYLNSRGVMPRWGGILNPDPRRDLVGSAVEAAATQHVRSSVLKRDLGFFLDELAWISEMGIATEAEYLTTERVGRRDPLSPSARVRVWEVRNGYLKARADDGVAYDWLDLATSVRAHLASDTTARRYRHIVIDEGQDLSPEAIRSLVEAVDPDGSVTFFGDYAQQIYGQGLSWRQCGLKVTQVERFIDNYRNTAQIARLAMAMSAMPSFGGDPRDLVAPVAPVAAGPLPTLVECGNEVEEQQVISRLAKQRGATGTVAVLGRTWSDARRACHGLSVRKLHKDMNRWDPTPGIYCGAYHSAKGLEFDTVLLPFGSDAHVPHPDVVRAFGPDEAASREAKLLYVGVTRARLELVMTYSGNLTPLVPTDSGLWTVTTP